MSTNDLWTTTHGMVFGFIFLLGFAGALVGVYMMKSEWLTTEGTNANVNRLRAFLWLLTAAVWVAVFTGTYIVYPWCRAAPPEGTIDLTNFPRYLGFEPANGWTSNVARIRVLAWSGHSLPCDGTGVGTRDWLD